LLLNFKSHIIAVVLNHFDICESPAQLINAQVQIDYVVNLTLLIIFVLDCFNSILDFLDYLAVEICCFGKLQFGILIVARYEVVKFIVYHVSDFEFNYVTSAKFVFNVLGAAKAFKNSTFDHDAHLSR